MKINFKYQIVSMLTCIYHLFIIVLDLNLKSILNKINTLLISLISDFDIRESGYKIFSNYIN